MINKAGLFSRLNLERNLSKQTFAEVLFYLSSIPVRAKPDGTLDGDLAQIVKQGFEFINTFYLEFNSKHEAQPAVHNLLMINYDNFLDVNDDGKIREMTVDYVKEVVQRYYGEVLPENIRMLAVELAFL